MKQMLFLRFEAEDLVLIARHRVIRALRGESSTGLAAASLIPFARRSCLPPKSCSRCN